MCNKCNGNCNSCDCTCNKPCNTPDCACKVFITTDCVTMTEDLPCSNIPKGQTETEVLKQLDAYICARFTSVENFLQLVNVGNGAGVYKGISVLGKKELKSLTSNGTIVITENADTINFSVNLPTPVDQDLQSVLDTGNTAQQGTSSNLVAIYQLTELGLNTYSTQAIGTERSVSSIHNLAENSYMSQYYSPTNSVTDATTSVIDFRLGELEIYQNINGISGKNTKVRFETPLHTDVNLLFPTKEGDGTYIIATVDQIPTIDGSETKIANGTNTTVLGNGTIATPYQISVNGSETKITPGTNVTITGDGTTGNPYIINSTATGATTVINAGTNISVTGSGTGGSPYVIDNTQVIDGSETKLISGITTVVSGTGTTGTPYKVEAKNLQKPITGDYTLLATDDQYSIKVNNGSTPITITVPPGLPENFFVGITQKGTGDITLAGGAGVTLSNPTGLKIEGVGLFVGVEQIGSTNIFDILGNTKA